MKLTTEKIPIRIISSANLVEHWSKKYKREKEQKFLISQEMLKHLDKISLPVTLTFVRIAPRMLDDDNLQYSLKSHRDLLSSLLIPGLAPGRADGDSRLEFKYEQEKGDPKEYALKIIFETKQ